MRTTNRVLAFASSGLVVLSTIVGVTALAPTAALAATGTVSYVASASHPANAASNAVTIPASVAPNDTLLLFFTDNADATITTPAGWTQIQAKDGSALHGVAWTRQATAGLANTAVTVTTSVATKSVLSVAAYRSSVGSSSVSASASSIASTAVTSHTTPTVSVATAGSWLVNDWNGKASSTTTWTLPTGTNGSTQRTTGTQTGGGLISSALGDSNAPVATGTAAGRTATTSVTAKDVMFSVVVAPGSDTNPTDNPPVAAFTSNCSGLNCTFDAGSSSDPDPNTTLTYAWTFGDGQSATGVLAAHTYAAAGSDNVTLTVSDGTLNNQVSHTVNPSTPVGGPGHTVEVSNTVQTNMPRITDGQINDLAYIGNNVYVAGNFTSVTNHTSNNTTKYSYTQLISFNLTTGLVNANFHPVIAGGDVQDVEATPDGTKLFIAGKFNTVNGTTKRKFASINPTTGATVTGWTANANAAGTELAASNSTVYLGGQFTTINSQPHVGLAAVSATTGALVGSTTGNPAGTWNNDISGGIGPNGALIVQELKLTPDGSTLIVLHTGRQIAGQDRYGVGEINTSTGQLLPWETNLWADNLVYIGGIQRAFAMDVSPDGKYFVVTAGSGGDRPPISDTVVAFPVTGGDDTQPLWIERSFDSVYSVAISEVAIYIGGHFSWVDSQTADNPYPGLTNVGYGTGQGLGGYALGDQVLRRDHVADISPSNGRALSWDPGSDSFEGNKAMLVTPYGLIAAGDATTQGNAGVGRIAVYPLQTADTSAYKTTIDLPIEGRVVPSATDFTASGTATATSGVKQVQVEITNRGTGRDLQDDLTTWGPSNTINAPITSTGATTANWSLNLNIPGNNALTIYAKTLANNGSSDSTRAQTKFETFSTTDATPTASISGPSGVQQTTFTVTGTASDDVGVRSIGYTVRDVNSNFYLQDDGSAAADYNSFNIAPDVVDGKTTTWSVEITVPYEGQWQMQVTPHDTAGQSSLDTYDATWVVNNAGIAPSVAISQPVVMTPPTAAQPITMAPTSSPVTFSGTANDDQNLEEVDIILRNTTTHENLTSDGTWGVNAPLGFHRVTPLNLNTASTSWSYTTNFTLDPGSYQFFVEAIDDTGLTTASANWGSLTINVQVPGDTPPNGLLNVTGTQVNQQTHHLDLAGTATDDVGVSSVLVSLQDTLTNLYLQPNGTMGSAFATRAATLSASGPGATNITWTLSVDLPSDGNYAVTALAFDTSNQQDLSTTGATATYPMFPGDQPPVVDPTLELPTSNTAFNQGVIQVSGRVNDDHQIAQAQVAIVDSGGHYLGSSGTFGTTTAESWRTAFLNSPGSAGSNFAYTSPVIPDGTYTVRVRGVDSHGFITNPTYDVTGITVTHPPNNPPVAAFTQSCTETPSPAAPPTCTFDARSSTDEDTLTLTYAWSFGDGTTGSGAVVHHVYTRPGTFTVTLTAKDYWGLTNPTTQTVTITEPPGNVAPTGSINDPACNGLVCNISATATDANPGDVITKTWVWGDNSPNTVTTSNASIAHTFPSAATYTVTVTFTDGWGKSSTATKSVTVGP